MGQERPHLEFLDGIRGLAALWVMLAHCTLWAGWGFRIVPDPKIAVDIFMCLSGYVMVYQSQRRIEQSVYWKQKVCAFYIKRFFRIAPVYYLMLMISMVVRNPIASGLLSLQKVNYPVWTPHGISLDQGIYYPYRVVADLPNILWHITFAFGLAPQRALSTFLPDWSIGLEMQFYAIFPFLLTCYKKFGPFAPSLLLTAISLAVTPAINGMASPVQGSPTYFPEPSLLIFKLPLFLAGMITAEAAVFPASTNNSEKVRVILALGIASLYSHYVFGTIAIMFVLVTASSSPLSQATCIDLIRKTLSNRVTRFLASTSYSVYLCHSLWIALCGRVLFTNSVFLAFTPPIRTVVMTGTVCFLSYVTGFILCTAVEEPGIRVGRYLAARWRLQP